VRWRRVDVILACLLMQLHTMEKIVQLRVDRLRMYEGRWRMSVILTKIDGEGYLIEHLNVEGD
jgi:hypothetical protein